MPEYTTDTGRTLVPESHYEAMVNQIKEKKVKEFTIYDWMFEALVNGKPFYFTISLFSSQMRDLLVACGAQEVSPNRFSWKSEDIVGSTVSFNLTHVADKKGIIRETLSDIKMLSPKSNNPGGVIKPEDIAWDEK